MHEETQAFIRSLSEKDSFHRAIDCCPPGSKAILLLQLPSGAILFEGYGDLGVPEALFMMHYYEQRAMRRLDEMMDSLMESEEGQQS